MKVTEASLIKRYNTGDFEYEEYSLVAQLDEEESASAALLFLKEEIKTAYAGKAIEKQKEEGPKNDSAPKKKKASKKKETEVAEPEETEEAEEVAAEETPKKKKKKVSPQTYDRTNEKHKAILSGILKSVAPNWKKSDALVKKAKRLSKEMQGKDFLDDNGEIYKSFKNTVKKYMSAK